jgi:threonine dehydratase
VIAYSSGNHAQGIALACRMHGVNVTVLMPSDAPLMKREATRGYGATVVLFDRRTEDREAMAAEYVKKGMILIPSYDHPDIIAGQGTAAKELFEEIGPLDRLYVPLGGGGLISGSAIAAARLSPGCKVIGVEPEAGADGRESWKTNRIVHIPTPDTIADGAQTNHIGHLPLPIMRRHVHDIVTVNDQRLCDTMRFVKEEIGMVVEPTGCLGLAAVLAKALPVKKGERIGVILSGGNVDVEKFDAYVAQGRPMEMVPG